MSDLRSKVIHSFKASNPGMWRFPTNPQDCCIYRVPSCLRQVNPEAYTPQLVLVGPLHHSLKSQALEYHGDKTISAKLMGYFNMEEHKKIYLAEFAKRLQGKKSIDEFKRMIQEDEDMIRASYSESTAWIQSQEFVDMILLDSVFILELMLRTCEKKGSEKIGDPLMDVPCLEITIKRDLIMLENQLPYFILEKLFDPIVSQLLAKHTLGELIIAYFEVYGVQENPKFKHFTDLVRCVRVETVPNHGSKVMFKPIGHMYNAYKLDNGGVKFEVLEDEMSVKVEFKKGCLKIPRFVADDEAEITLRNIVGLEQCHYPFNAHVSNYILFLDLLIDTEKDVDLLVEKGVIRNMLGHHGAVAQMVNNLGLGVLDNGSYYSDIAVRVQAHYSDPIVKSWAILKRVYFGNLWTGTATVAATFLLIMTLIQTVASILQSWSWRSLLSLRSLAALFTGGVSENGHILSFWYDYWTGLGPLITLFGEGRPREIGLSLHSSVANACSITEHFSWFVDGKSSDSLSSRATWECIRPRAQECKWVDAVWFKGATPRFPFIFWLANLSMLSTRSTLVRLGMNIQDSCCLCNGA